MNHEHYRMMRQLAAQERLIGVSDLIEDRERYYVEIAPQHDIKPSTKQPKPPKPSKPSTKQPKPPKPSKPSTKQPQQLNQQDVTEVVVTPTALPEKKIPKDTRKRNYADRKKGSKIFQSVCCICGITYESNGFHKTKTCSSKECYSRLQSILSSQREPRKYRRCEGKDCCNFRTSKQAKYCSVACSRLDNPLFKSLEEQLID